MTAQPSKRKILVLHGDRQTGDLLKARIGSLKRKLLKQRQPDGTATSSKSGSKKTVDDDTNYKIELVAPDGPFQWKLDPSVHVEKNTLTEEQKRENDLMRTWWNRNANEYGGLTDSLNMLHEIWEKDEGFEGIIGFSRGARLTHLVATLHEASKGKIFRNLRYVVMASGYGHVPMPENFPPTEGIWNENIADYNEGIFPLSIPSMHIMGAKDRLIPVEASRALLPSYVDPVVYEHDGGHHVPMRAADVKSILSFIDSASLQPAKGAVGSKIDGQSDKSEENSIPDEEHALAQTEECDSLAIIFPDQFQLLSKTNGSTIDEYGEEKIDYVFPISYAIQLKPPPEEIGPDEEKLWPTKNIALKVEYTAQYPDCAPLFSLHHEMNLLEFKLCQEDACLNEVKKVAESEIGMPCIMSCVYRAREFFEEGGLVTSLQNSGRDSSDTVIEKDQEDARQNDQDGKIPSLAMKSASQERIKACIDEGLQLAYSILERNARGNNTALESNECGASGKGGSWNYTIGLVGKPSAGKSTFFNAASAFARQRGGDGVDADGNAIGGASMAPHPFTTIDPNVGFCLVPAPDGACPEDDMEGTSGVACTHGRDSFGRRLIPVMLKDVAGLVPGAYEGRGRGNKFLDDLTDADVLIHVLDSSGTADAEGNAVVVDLTAEDADGSNPLDDLDWIFNELIQWIFCNLITKWNGIVRRGQEKLAGMFTGYKQNQAFIYDVFVSLEKYLYEKEGRDHALDKLDSWDEGDIYRLVAVFLGVRFPVALALNKHDLPSSEQFCQEILGKLPIHGAHSGTPLSAYHEMKFVRKHIYSVLESGRNSKQKNCNEIILPPHGVWDCLQSAIKLREPILVFPVADMESYQPLSGMTKKAQYDPSLPNTGMVACLKACGGVSPTLWNDEKAAYEGSSIGKNHALRDVLVLKPGSTVEDAFISLKNAGVLGGEFVRAEAVGGIGDKPHLVKKDDTLGRHNRILKIMTTKRREWQKSA